MSWNLDMYGSVVKRGERVLLEAKDYLRREGPAARPVRFLEETEDLLRDCAADRTGREAPGSLDAALSAFTEKLGAVRDGFDVYMDEDSQNA